MTAAAFSAAYADWKLVKSRKVVQIVLEVAMEDSDAAYKLLGGMPNPAAETWVGVAKLNKKPDREQKERRRWNELPLSQQASIRCGEHAFQEFIRLHCDEAKRPDGIIQLKPGDDVNDPVALAAAMLRTELGIESRKELNTNKTAASKWRELDGHYDLWCRSGQ
jgi:hypothetical protein